jgi:acetaldehyde dehydrogenase (acetylating)
VARVLVLPNLRINPKLVGHSAEYIAREAGISVPVNTRVLVTPIDGIGKQHPLSTEKLSSVLAFYVVNDCQGGMDACRRLLEFGGLGHTLAIHATDERVIREFALQMPASRIVINSPATHGAVGDSTNLEPSMSLGCGTWGGNITTDNISVRHLLNIKRVAYEVRPVNPGEAGETAVRAASAVPVTSASVPTAPGASGSAVPDQAEIARIVDHFLARRGVVAPPQTSKPCPAMSGDSSAEQPAECPCASSTDKKAAQPAAETPPPAPKPVDFVSEDDVRQAINKNEKIYVTPRAIITPSARDLGNPREIFVVVK